MSKIKKLFPAICMMLMLIFSGMEIVQYHQSAYAETHAADAHGSEHHGRRSVILFTGYC